mgnify:CR=1 FL=1
MVSIIRFTHSSCSAQQHGDSMTAAQFFCRCAQKRLTAAGVFQTPPVASGNSRHCPAAWSVVHCWHKAELSVWVASKREKQSSYASTLTMLLGTPHYRQQEPYLQHIQRDAPANDGAYKGHHERHKVDRQLELQELPDAVEHSAAPQHSPAGQ